VPSRELRADSAWRRGAARAGRARGFPLHAAPPVQWLRLGTRLGACPVHGALLTQIPQGCVRWFHRVAYDEGTNARTTHATTPCSGQMRPRTRVVRRRSLTRGRARGPAGVLLQPDPEATQVRRDQGTRLQLRPPRASGRTGCSDFTRISHEDRSRGSVTRIGHGDRASWPMDKRHCGA
jgi:hypothetical protein